MKGVCCCSAEMLGQAEALVEEDSLQGRMVKMMFSNMAFYCECLRVFGSGSSPQSDTDRPLALHRPHS